MIKSIKIKRLYGHLDREIDFNKDITILVGKNGCGKTTILNILNAIINDRFDDLFKHSFLSIYAKFNKDRVLIKRFDTRMIVMTYRTIDYNNEYVMEKIVDKVEDSESLNELNDNLLELGYKGRKMTLEKGKEYEKETSTNLKLSSLYFPTYRRTEVDFEDLLKELGSYDRPRYVYERDIYMHSRFSEYRNRVKDTIVGISNKDISEIIKNETMRVSRREAMKLNSLISRFFLCFLNVKENTESIDLKEVDIKKLNTQIKQIFSKTGLGSKNGGGNSYQKIDEYTEIVAECKATYAMSESAKDIADILKDYDFINSVKHSVTKMQEIIDIYEKECVVIEKIKSPFKELKEILSDFLNPMVVSLENGELYFHKHSDDKERLEFEDLSAGEKQLVTLFVYTRLSTSNNSIVLIDEPELSLHIIWQRKIIEKLLSGSKDIQYIVATHSPSVIAPHRDKIVKIGEYEDVQY